VNGGTLAGSGSSRTLLNDISIGGSGGEIGGSYNITAAGVISGGTLTKTGSGTLDIVGNNNTFSALNLNGGVVGFQGTGGNLLSDTAAISLGGGTLEARNKTEAMGALTLASSSILQLQADSTPGALTFASASRTGGTLTVKGWSGVADLTVASTPGTDDRIFITGAASSDFLSNVNFEGYPTGGKMLGSELVPVPEPQQYAMMIGFGLMGFAAYRRYSRKSA
jgi:autotransporter-associated beta strand protein